MAKPRIIRGFLINRKIDHFGDYVFNYTNYKDIYPLINCSCFTIVTRKFGGYYLDVICDDEGLLKNEQIPSIVTVEDGQPVEVIVNDLFICKHDDNGNMVSLNNDEKAAVNHSLHYRNGITYLEANL